MSIVGTRPPLIGEVNLYELHHHARLAIKPGIKNLTNLMLLDISNNDINDLTPILGLTRLQNLYARNNKLTEIPDMKGLSSLMLYSSINGDPESIFIGNLIPREGFEGKFNQKLTEEWLNKNSYDATVIEIPDENLAKAIRNLVPDSDGDGKFNKSELRALTTLYANGRHSGFIL